MTENARLAAGDPAPQAHELRITRLLNAPREIAFRAWTSPEHLAHWWGPRDDRGRAFTMPHCEMDFRPGGRYRICIRSPQGEDYWHSGRYVEIQSPARLLFTFAWEREGEPFPQTLIEVTFEEQARDRTLLTFRQRGLPSDAERIGHESGWIECLDRLSDHLRAAAGGGSER